MAAGLLLAAAAFGQTPGQTPAPTLAFEVASVKPAGPLDPAKMMSGQMRIGMNVDAARVDIGSLSLSDLISIAFRVKPYQISGPNWLGGERFSIQAKLPEGATKEQVPEMLQALLVERFKLAFHREDKEQAIYALVVGKNGSKLKESPPDVSGAAGAPLPAGDSPAAASSVGMAFGTGKEQVRMSGRPDSKGGMVVQGGPNGTMRMSMGPGGTMRMETEKMTMAAFVQMLSRFLDRPVVDMTDLKGNYQVAVDLSMEDMRNAAKSAGMAIPAAGGDPGRMPMDAASDPSGGSIFHSVQELGLKLEPRKSPVGRIVIDHLERTPTEN